MELEECKHQVAREGTRLFEREEMSIRGQGMSAIATAVVEDGLKPERRQQAERERRSTMLQGSCRREKRSVPLPRNESLAHLKMVLALEALIASLRSHLTSELASIKHCLASSVGYATRTPKPFGTRGPKSSKRSSASLAR